MLSRIKSLILHSTLLLGGLIVGLALSEAIIRLIQPELRDVVEARFEQHHYRIHANPRNTRLQRKGPDSQEVHDVLFNNLGFHQHRSFEKTKPEGLVRIGIFGDSFTANLRMPAPYSFTEPLQHLLRDFASPAEVLNFGVDGYGTDQIYLHYLDEGVALDLDIVLYVFCHNDLRDTLANNLFTIEPSGELQYRPRRQSRFWISVIKRFYLTYFIAERSQILRERLAPSPWDRGTILTAEQEKQNRRKLAAVLIESESPEKRRAKAIFHALMAKMRDATASHGQDFQVVLLPRIQEANKEIEELLTALGIETLDLFPIIEREAQDRRELFFRSDSHWNEEGNKIVAVHLFKDLMKQQDLPLPTDREIRQSLFAYYAAFAPTRVSESWLEEIEVSEQRLQEIRASYQSQQRSVEPAG